MPKNLMPDSSQGKSLNELILDVFNQKPERVFNYRQIAKKLHITDNTIRVQLQNNLQQLKNQGTITEFEPGRYKLKLTGIYVTGNISISKSGIACVVSDNNGEEIYIPQKDISTAMDGDFVKVHAFKKTENKEQHGKVIEILQRKKTEFVGTVNISSNFALLIPDSRKTSFNIYIPKKLLNNAQHGDKAIACITDWNSRTNNPYGKIVKVLGVAGSSNVEIDSIVYDADVSLTFPKEVETEAHNIQQQISNDEISKRRDFRDVTTFTIDPEDAKDFDDALSFKKLNNGNYEVGVHIADVSFYVTENSFLDEEAYKRGTSIYLVDRVIPMLPERLSNNICSLRPNEDKLCFSAVFELDNKANVLNQWFGKTIINSNKRFTYEEAQQIIESKQGKFAEEILLLDMLASILRKDRFEKGSIFFDKEEMKFRLDEQGKPVEIFIKIMRESNKLIEDFMLLANKKAAELIALNNKHFDKHCFVYRIHDVPQQDDIKQFAGIARKFGYKIDITSHNSIAKSYNFLLKDVIGKKEQHFLQQLAIRTMSKAIYTTHKKGHYGLSFKHYTHFTSPIRRYPDLMVHRLLFQYLNTSKLAGTKTLEDKCKYTSQMEQKAADLERMSTKYKQAEYLQDKIGNIYNGIITGISEWGIFVEIIENKCEGMIRLRDIKDDYYKVDEKNYYIIGSRHKKKYQLGDTVKIKVNKVNISKRFIDFLLIQ